MNFDSYKKNVARFLLLAFFLVIFQTSSGVLGGVSSTQMLATIGAVGVGTGSYGWGADGASGSTAGDGRNGGAGWIDMKDVSVDSYSGLITGTAWSSNFGWLQFGNLSGAPVTAANPSEDALLDGDQVYGWARFCNGSTDANDCSGESRADGWDGWVSLRGPQYGLELDTDDRIKGFAWGGVAGWMYFNMDAGAGYIEMTCAPNDADATVNKGDTVTWSATGVTEADEPIVWTADASEFEEVAGPTVSVTYGDYGTYGAYFVTKGGEGEVVTCEPAVEVADTSSGSSCSPIPNYLQIGDSGEVTWNHLDVPEEEVDSVTWYGDYIDSVTGEAVYDTEFPGTYGANLVTTSADVICEPLYIGILPVDYSVELSGSLAGKEKQYLSELAVKVGDGIDLHWELGGFLPEECSLSKNDSDLGTLDGYTDPLEQANLQNSSLYKLSCEAIASDTRPASGVIEDTFRVRVSGGGDTEEF